MNEKMKKLGFIFVIISLLLIPGLQVLFIVGNHTKYLIRMPFFVMVIALLIISVLLLVTGIILFVRNRKANDKKLKTWKKVLFSIFMSFYVIGCIGFVVLLYGPNEKFKTWLITTAMQTMNHQYYCKWFYSQSDIDDIINNNYVEESGESTDTTLIEKHEYKYKKDSYENDYERQILDVEDYIKYQIIRLSVNGCNGYLAVIYDPSKVKLAVTPYVGSRGQYVTQMAEANNAIIGINGGGFSDPGHNSSGGAPTGITISDGKVITNGEYGYNNQGGGIIGFTNDDVLVLLKNTTAQQALDMGVRDAVSWGPFLIVNGTPSFIKGNGGWGYAARTAIGQRADGIVLLLVIDSNATRTKGADMVDLTEIMQNYGAVNAANLDGGTSSVMVMPKEIAQSQYNAPCSDYRSDTYCAINDPIDGALKHQTRPIADAWVVVE